MTHLIVDAATGQTVPTPADFDAFIDDLKRPADAEPQQPLNPTGALATLLAVEQVVTVQDAANAVGLTPADLIAEAEAWAAAQEANL